MDHVVYATLLHCKSRSSSKGISCDQLSVNLWINFLRILCFRALLVWSASWCCIKLCPYSDIIRSILGFSSLWNLWLNQLYLFQGVPAIYYFFRYHLGITIRRCGIIVWVSNFSTLFLPELKSYLSVPRNRFSRSCA